MKTIMLAEISEVLRPCAHTRKKQIISVVAQSMVNQQSISHRVKVFRVMDRHRLKINGHDIIFSDSKEVVRERPQL